MRNQKFIISGGGTGGHIFPAISIADELKSRFSHSDILFVGSRDRMEMVKVPAHGYEIKGLWISGLNRKFTLNNLLFPFKLIFSLIQSIIIILKFKPDAVVGTRTLRVQVHESITPKFSDTKTIDAGFKLFNSI